MGYTGRCSGNKLLVDFVAATNRVRSPTDVSRLWLYTHGSRLSRCTATAPPPWSQSRPAVVPLLYFIIADRSACIYDVMLQPARRYRAVNQRLVSTVVRSVFSRVCLLSFCPATDSFPLSVLPFFRFSRLDPLRPTSTAVCYVIQVCIYKNKY